MPELSRQKNVDIFCFCELEKNHVNNSNFNNNSYFEGVAWMSTAVDIMHRWIAAQKTRLVFFLIKMLQYLCPDFNNIFLVSLFSSNGKYCHQKWILGTKG